MDLTGRESVDRASASADNPAEKTRRGGRPRREAMTLSGLHQKFLLYCEVEKRLSAATIRAYRSDFEQFMTCLRERGRYGLASQDRITAVSVANIRVYQ